MQLLRLIRCEARRLLRNPAFFVLLIWGIWIVKDVWLIFNLNATA